MGHLYSKSAQDLVPPVVTERQFPDREGLPQEGSFNPLTDGTNEKQMAKRLARWGFVSSTTSAELLGGPSLPKARGKIRGDYP